MTLPEAILFDMDGTIVDTEPLWEGAEGQVLAEMGTQMTPQMRQKMLGSTLPRMVAILRSFARNPLDEAVVADRVEQGVIDRLDAGLPWKQGLVELLSCAMTTQFRRRSLQRRDGEWHPGFSSMYLRHPVLRMQFTEMTSRKENPHQRGTSRQLSSWELISVAA